MNRVELSFSGVPDASWAPALAAWMESAMSAMGVDRWDVSVLLCDDRAIRELNGRYRNIDEPTDVLSFVSGDEYEDDELGTRVNAGDIAISLDTLAANAAYFSVVEDEELKRLALHGLLHLSGLDHEDNDPSREMLRYQEDLLEKLPKERILP